jgi:hypothetical protein
VAVGARRPGSGCCGGVARRRGWLWRGLSSPVRWCLWSRVACWSPSACRRRAPGVAAARATLVVHATLPPAPAPERPVLFFNPRSGGGKAERLSVATGHGRGSSRSSLPATTGDAGPWGRSRRRCAGDGRRDGRRRSSRRSRPSWVAVRVRARRHDNHFALDSASTAMTSSARWTRLSTGASARWISPRSTGACSSTTSRWLYAEAVQHGATVTPEPHAARHRARRARPGGGDLDLQ